MVASELFEICQELAQSQPSADATRRLHEVLTLLCAEGCRQQGGAFGNLFAQVDFLCKRLGLTATESRSMQTARRHSNTGVPIDATEWPYDVKAVARLISAVFHEDMPGPLLRLLPANERPQPKGLRINKDYVRCIVDSFDDSVVQADTEEGRIVIDYQNTDGGRDFAYLRKLLRQGMQLNLLECHVDGTTVVPGLVVVEPDFLIDISSLAACFTSYGHHPLLYTLNRLKERPNTQATLLGNFAGTALDEEVAPSQPPPEGEEKGCRRRETPPPRGEAGRGLLRSFREQALRFCACPDFDAVKFKALAEEQVKNIREAVSLLRPQLDAGSPLLEPSFVCERLGLQGRVDLMTSRMPTPLTHDNNPTTMLLVEQKSGKNMKIEHQSRDSHGLQLESHYVQLLLYYGVLRFNFGLSDRQVDTRLLYSRYPAAQGLLTVNYYRALLRQAIQLRNQIVCTDLLIARDGARRILPLLTPDVIYQGVSRDAHFHRYVLPEIQLINSQLSHLPPLERAYYERMLTFVYREQVAAKLGSAETRLHHTGGCAADLWEMPLAEKLETGNIILAEMDAPPASPTEGGAQLVRLSMHASSLAQEEGPGVGLLNFRQGDMVYLYHYEEGNEPDVRRSILFKGTLQELTTDHLAVALNNEQHNPDVFRPGNHRLWAVEHGDSDVGTGAAIRSLHRFITCNPHRRALLLGQRPPEANTSVQLSRSYHPDYDDVLQRQKQARDYFLLVGPPGTGKTSMALRYIVEEAISSGVSLSPPPQGEVGRGPAVLLTAYTNRAVDEICAMLCEVGTPFLRLGKAASCDERYRPYLLDTALAETKRLDDARRLISETPIIVATTSTLQAQPYILELKHFACCIVDEASQILEPAIIGLLSSPAVDRFVLVGDHKQLPAVVQQSQEQSAVEEPLLRAIGLEDCRQSLFERLLRWEQRQSRTQFIGTLHTHGRMHPLVAQFPLKHFYQREQLKAVPLPHQREDSLGYTLPARDLLDEELMTKRLLFLPNEGNEETEARLVADLLRRIHRFTQEHFDPAKTVGVIVPYRHQIALIRQAIGSDKALQSVTIDTVERYQGSQRDVIIYSFAVSHRYQLDFLTATTFTDEDGTLVDRKLNVALTRARRQTIITGRPDLLRSVPLFRQLIDGEKISAVF
ncbi:MAG: DNA2/NAM7 family helicase [Prevotella sp.]|nr:DNA2/NAM7 family helicase [Prevotella sp.]